MKIYKKSKKLPVILLIVLIAALVLAALASCQTDVGKSEVQNKEDISEEQGKDDGETAEETTERLYPDIEAKDFGGHEFTFLGRTIVNVDWAEWDHRDLVAEELNGDVINDAVFMRNRKIEDKYNIAIAEIIDTDAKGKLTKAVKAGDDIYDIFCAHVNEFPDLSQNGNLIDIFSMPYLDLEKPWWDQGTIRDLTLIGRLFFVQGDVTILDNDSMEAMIFNKTLLQEAALENPYELVKNGEWTFDKLIEMSRGVSKDLNGDGEMYIKDDRFGTIIQRDTTPSFIISGGEKIVGKDEDDYPVITFYSERCVRILDALSELIVDEENVVHLHRYEGKFGIYDEQVKMFEENRALFSWIRMRIVERLRGMEMDFGILPCPKLDTAQKNYYTQNNPHTGVGITIPVSASDLDRTGMILEDLCAESRYTLQPAYYEINLKGKYARDDDSSDMLDIILSNTAHDLGHVFNFADFASTIMMTGQNKKTDYASDFEKAEPKMQSAIDKMIDKYENLD